MRRPWEWEESDLLELISNQVQESLTLDYKACGALAKADSKRIELSKDVSAFANSAGGTLIYGVNEKDNLPTSLDAGYDPKEITREWIEQVINSGIQRRIDGVRIKQVQLESPGKVLYVVHVPYSMSAPHMASDKRFYKRFNFQSVPMEEYEVRDVGRRNETPDLFAEIHIAQAQHPFVALSVRIANRSPEPAFHASIRIYVEPSLKVLLAPGLTNHGDQIIPVRGYETRMQAFYMKWSVPPNLPIWENEPQSLTGEFLRLSYPRGIEMHRIAWHISSPRMGVRHGLFGLAEGVNGPELHRLE